MNVFIYSAFGALIALLLVRIRNSRKSKRRVENLKRSVPSNDPVVVYDSMRESANHLIATHLKQVENGGLEDPAIQAVRAIKSELKAVPLDDMKAQQAKTFELTARQAELLKTSN